MSSIILNLEIYNNTNSINDDHKIQNAKDQTPEQSDDFIPIPSIGEKYWNFTTGEIVGWRISTDYSSRDTIFNITNLKYFTEPENVTGSEEAYEYYGVQLTPAYYNISTHKVEEFTNRTLFPLLNASLINYTLSKVNGFSINNLISFAFQNGEIPIEYFINLFVPTNKSNNFLDIYWVAGALHWWYSIFLNGNFDNDGNLITPQYSWELCDLIVTPNSIHYSKPSKGTYCNLYYYDNGTLRTAELKALVMPQMTLKINWTRIFDFDPLNNLKWSKNFDEVGEKLYIGMDTNETMLEFNRTVDNMELVIEWNDEYEEWEIELLYYQEIWANFSYWNYDTKQWVYINCTVVASANELSPIVFGGGDNGDDDGGDDNMFLPPFILIPNQSTYLKLGDMFKIFELVPEWSDLRIQTGDNWVKLTNTSSSKIAVFSYQPDGILEYIYIQGVGPFEEMTKDNDDDAIMFYYKNETALSSSFNTFSLHTFDLGSLSAVINISVAPPSGFYHSGFPYNPTNQSISNALGFFDIFILDEGDLVKTYSAPINITFNYDYKTYKSVKVYWFNMSADNNKGAWEEIPIKYLGNGVIVITLNHTSIIVFTASKIVPLPSGDDDDDNEKEKEAAIPFGNFYLLFLAFGIIGLIIYGRRKYLKNIF